MSIFVGSGLTNQQVVDLYRKHEHKIRSIWAAQKGTMRDAVELYLKHNPQPKDECSPEP